MSAVHGALAGQDPAALRPATHPSLYFIGVSTGHSSIMHVFPAWARHLGLGDVRIVGIDLPLHAPPADYRRVVQFLKTDPLSLGALVTTHKIDLYAACRDLFDEVDAYALALGETSCLSKRGGRFVCHAKDPVSAGLAVDGFLPPGHFERTGAAAFLMGAGGASIALSCHLMQAARGADRPGRLVISDPSAQRLQEIARIHQALGALDIPCEYRLVDGSAGNDALLAQQPPGTLVVNATGLGKDRPGSPLSDAAEFPLRAVAWEFNYRGHLRFLDQARRQQASRGLQVEDGWTYFIHGWTRVIAEVFGIGIATDGPGFDALSRIAGQVHQPAPSDAAMAAATSHSHTTRRHS